MPVVEVPIEVPDQPVYCGNCKSRDTWERNPSGDWEPYHIGYKCRVCGHTTLRAKKSGMRKNNEKQT